MAIDTTASTAMRDLMTLAIQLSSQANERRWRSDEALLSREFTSKQTSLASAAEEFQYLRARKDTLEDSMRGYKLPYEQTKAGKDMINGTLETYTEGSSSLLTQIGQLTEQLALIADAKTFAKGQADQYGDIIEAGKGEAWRDYLLEGTLEMGTMPSTNVRVVDGIATPLPGEKGLVGTGEMSLWLEKQSPETIEKLKDENYRRSMLSSLRTIEEAKNLQMIDQQMEATRVQIEAAEATIREKNYAFAIQQHEEIEKNFGEMYKNTSLSAKANFRYVSDNVPYKLTDLTDIAATEPGDFIDIKNDFLKDPANHAILAEAESFITGIQTAAAMGMDDSEWVVRFQKAAYDDFLLLRGYEERLTREGVEEGRTLAQMISALPDNDPAKLDITRLRAKHEGYKKLGLFAGGFEILNRSSAMVGMHNKQQADRLAMDIDEATRISQEGLGLPPIEDFYPSNVQQMTPKEVKDLEIALATITAFTPLIPGVRGGGGAVPFKGPVSRAELDVFESVPSAPSRDYWRGPINVLGEALDEALTSPNILIPSYVDPSAPSSLAANIGASLDELQRQNPDENYNKLAGIYTNSNYLKSTGVPFAKIAAAFKASGESDLGDWLIDMFPDIEADLIR